MIKTLWELMQGEKCLVQGFSQALDESYRVRLMELGFHPGEQVTCVQVPRLGAPKLYRVNNTIYSLDDSVATLVDIRVSE
ncbi:MAG: ferrous iron transport protein A [Gammaproteobacteria bacterium]|nr:ferrous iron transport protein A [Gammaproteobacteria bacterium]